MLVSTTVPAMRSLRSRLTFSCRAFSTTRSSRQCSVWVDQVGATNEGRRIGHPLSIHPTELAQHQAIADELLGRCITSGIELLDDQHAQDDLDRCGGAAI